LLWAAGETDLDAPVQKYCRAFPAKDTPITIRELLGHLARNCAITSRIHRTTLNRNTRHFLNPIQSGIDFFKHDSLVSKRGRRGISLFRRRGSPGWAAPMNASGEQYINYVRENVLARQE